MNKSPLVSVVMITYNHEKYIKQAIEGVLMQKTDFDVELIIANDCSTDNTHKEINDIIKKYNGLINIRYYNHTQNKGVMENSIWTLKKVTGKYIAFCEGDDYWTNKNKIQIQFNSLEKNINIDICSHKVNKYDEDKQIIVGLNGNNGDMNTIIPMHKIIKLYGTVAPMASIFIRKNKIGNLLKVLTNDLYGSHGMIQLIGGEPGGLYYIAKTMATYRMNSKSSVTKNILNSNYYKVLQKRKESFYLINLLFKKKYNSIFQEKIDEINKNILLSKQTTFKEKFDLLKHEKIRFNIFTIIYLLFKSSLLKTKHVLLS